MGTLEENKLLKETFEKIVEILREADVYPGLDCKLHLSCGVEIVKLIEECQSKLQNNK